MVVVKGQLQHKGMAAFGAEVTPDRAKAIRAYIVSEAIAAKKDEDKAKVAAK
jgi:hypothetical protein